MLAAMKESIRCLISCILPCGALDMIRIVHSNGRVQHINATNIQARDIMISHPKHVLKIIYTSPSGSEVVPKIVIVSPETQLRRGKIYFLTPASASSHKPRSTKKRSPSKQREYCHHGNNISIAAANNMVCSDGYLSDGRRGRVGARSHLQSISESI